MIEQAIEMYGRAMTPAAYGCLVALAATMVWAVLWRIVTTPRRPVTAEPVSPTELAFLRSEIAPVVTALASLRAAGRITRNRRVDRTVPAGPERDPFTGQVLAQVATDPKHTVSGLFDAARGDLLALERHLSRRGLVRTRAERNLIRWGTAPSFLALAFTLGYGVYLAFQLSNRPQNVAPLVLLTLAVIGYGTAILPRLCSVDRLTRAGRRLLATEQQRLSYLKPDARPAFATYGPGAVALSVALFGTGALWAIDSEYSESVELAGGSSGGGVDGAGCGASCGGDGGGGCGGGCGGCGGCGG